MKGEKKNALHKKWLKDYLRQLAICFAVIVVLFVFFDYICSRKIWYKEDPLYQLLNFIDMNKSTICLLLILICAVFISAYNFRKIFSGIRQIIEAVDNLYAESDEEIVLPSQFGELENSMNQIRINARENRQAAREANQRKNDMIMYMAHDLKTPLTSVIGYLSLLCQEPDIPEKSREKYMNIALKKAQRLEELINEFFDITRFNFTHMILEKSNVNLSVMVRQMISEFSPQFGTKGLTVSEDIEDGIYLVCDVDKMERVFDNLFRNIVNYSYENTEIDLKLRKMRTGSVQLITQNKGKTIPREMQEHIFEQFFRLDSSRSSGTGGAGLGLAVTKEIVTLHGGTVICESENEWIRFTVTIPSSFKKS
ncbi:MAG: HAMP domain-containing sensor histidine kinase [Bacillota bacterium]|nr:HAMP domain-containing sensor histidine kinase [Bacillota bacterium]